MGTNADGMLGLVDTDLTPTGKPDPDFKLTHNPASLIDNGVAGSGVSRPPFPPPTR